MINIHVSEKPVPPCQPLTEAEEKEAREYIEWKGKEEELKRKRDDKLQDNLMILAVVVAFTINFVFLCKGGKNGSGLFVDWPTIFRFLAIAVCSVFLIGIEYFVLIIHGSIVLAICFWLIFAPLKWLFAKLKGLAKSNSDNNVCKLSPDEQRKEELLKRQKSLVPYNKALDAYKYEMKQLSENYPGLAACGYDVRRYSTWRARQFSFLLPDIVSRSRALFEAEGDYEAWTTCSDREFEIKTARWYMRKGYDVSLTPKSNDGGIDVIARKGGVTTYIQCKQYNAKVPVEVARELLGVMAAAGVKRGAIVCLYGGNQGTIDFAQRNGIRIITAQEICNDIGRNLSPTPAATTHTLTEEDGGWTYRGWGEFHVVGDTFSDLQSLRRHVVANILPLAQREVAVLRDGNLYYAVSYPKSQIERLADTLVENRIDIDKGDFVTPQPTDQTPAHHYTKRRRRYYR